MGHGVVRADRNAQIITPRFYVSRGCRRRVEATCMLEGGKSHSVVVRTDREKNSTRLSGPIIVVGTKATWVWSNKFQLP